MPFLWGESDGKKKTSDGFNTELQQQSYCTTELSLVKWPTHKAIAAVFAARNVLQSVFVCKVKCVVCVYIYCIFVFQRGEPSLLMLKTRLDPRSAACDSRDTFCLLRTQLFHCI